MSLAEEAIETLRGWLDDNRDEFEGARERHGRFVAALQSFEADPSQANRALLLADARDYFGEWSQPFASVVSLADIRQQANRGGGE